MCLQAFFKLKLNWDCLPEGGNTLLPGLPERLQAEVSGLVPSDSGKVVRVSSPQDRVFSVWRGGAALANLTSVGSSWISQEEYEEQGPQIVFRKCFWVQRLTWIGPSTFSFSICLSAFIKVYKRSASVWIGELRHPLLSVMVFVPSLSWAKLNYFCVLYSR